ncbi:hypothetical protein E3J38_09825 [candidate division TA06 bacterium]|uniref:Uncharacterized protein n=1 Tax=candidate division TA06 bacterium TaxID=2250710 RepID=A0A523XET8_UNCT6|nr:MAG: hypothetical protein E3J38_09825 [candidate division TA06 bacterium]
MTRETICPLLSIVDAIKKTPTGGIQTTAKTRTGVDVEVFYSRCQKESCGWFHRARSTCAVLPEVE